MNWPRKLSATQICLLLLFVCVLPSLALAQAGDAIARSSDYDGDNLGDIITYDSSTATFKIRGSSTGTFETVQVGYVGDRSAVGDFNGDGRADLASFGRYDGRWTILENGGGASNVVAWSGQKGDVPLPGNYNQSTGDELATYSRRSGMWTIADASGNILSQTVFGGPGKIGVPLDYDCDGYLDLAYFDQLSKRWVIRESRSQNQIMFKFGRSGDIPVPGDYDGDGCDEPGIYKPDINVFEYAASVSDGIGQPATPKQWGLLGDRPVPMNVDGDAALDFAIHRTRDGSFYISTSSDFFFKVPFIDTAVAPNTVTPWTWGAVSPQNPEFFGHWKNNFNRVLGDYDRDGKSDFVTALVNRTFGITTFTINNGYASSTVVVNAPGDALVPGDYNGDGITQPAVVTVISNGALQWTTKNEYGADSIQYWGVNGDQPIVGDFDCDGRTDRAVARDENGFIYWYFLFASGETQFSFLHGLADDKPFAADVDGDGCDELVNARLGDEGWYWFYTGLDEQEVKVLQWGLADDLPMRPNDLNGDGFEDFIVARNGVQRSLFRRSADARFINNPWPDYPWEEIKHGLNSDISVPGNYSGANRMDPGIFRRSGFAAPGFIFNLLRLVDVLVSTGSVSSVIVRPDGTIVQPGEGVPGGGGTTAPGCTADAGTDSDFLDGAGGGALWKPHSEGVSNGAPVVLLPIRYCGASVVVLGNTGEQVSGLQRTKCGGNGNRAHFWVSLTAGALTPYEPLTVKIVNDGITECRSVPDATQRYD